MIKLSAPTYHIPTVILIIKVAGMGVEPISLGHEPNILPLHYPALIKCNICTFHFRKSADTTINAYLKIIGYNDSIPLSVTVKHI